MLDAVLDRFTRLHPKVIDLSLDRMLRLLSDLGDPQDRLPPVIHVGGTNGKGSVVATLRALCEAAGLSVHAYTSPHLVRFAERIRIGGRLPDDGALAALLEEVEAVNAGKPITFFEATTAAALLAFARHPADVCLLEVGLGGRLDATNVVARPAACVLTAIGLDHQDYLGDTLGAIAGEKAPILRAGVPAACAAQAPEAEAAILARARLLGAPLWLGDEDWTHAETPEGFRVAAPGLELDAPHPALAGPHQVANAALAIVALHASGLVAPTPELVARALPAVAWPGRLQRLAEGAATDLLGRPFWLDGGHNPNAGEALAPLLAAWAAEGPLEVVLGMQTTKDPAGYLAAVAPHVSRLAAVPVPSAPAPFDPEILADAARIAGIPEVCACRSWEEALKSAKARRTRVLVAGSLYLVGEVLAVNRSGAPA